MSTDYSLDFSDTENVTYVDENGVSYTVELLKLDGELIWSKVYQPDDRAAGFPRSWRQYVGQYPHGQWTNAPQNIRVGNTNDRRIYTGEVYLYNGGYGFPNAAYVQDLMNTHFTSMDLINNSNYFPLTTQALRWREVQLDSNGSITDFRVGNANRTNYYTLDLDYNEIEDDDDYDVFAACIIGNRGTCKKVYSAQNQLSTGPYYVKVYGSNVEVNNYIANSRDFDGDSRGESFAKIALQANHGDVMSD